MGVLSEKMTSQKEQVEANDPDPPSLMANTDTDTDGVDRGEDMPQRASPISSEDSATERPQSSARLGGSMVASHSREGASSAAKPLEGATEQASPTDSADHATNNDTVGSGKARAFRSVSQDQADEFGVGDGSDGPEKALLQLSYQSAEAKVHAQSALPVQSSGQSAKSEPHRELGSGDGIDQSSSVVLGTRSDGPPQFITTKPTGPAKKPGNMRRRGKWTVEEEAYVARVIQDFNSGFLDAPAGTTLRTFLSDKLNCDPMRITKKFTGEACIGKRVFHPAIRSPSNAPAIDKAQSELEALEQRWRSRLEMQQRESAKKAAASAAAAAAAASSVPQGSLGDSALTGVPQNPILQTAAWLDRAKSLTSFPSNNIEVLPRNEVMHQMAEVQKLLSEGSTMQRTSAELPHVVEHSADQAAAGTPSGTASPPPEPADKRLRTGAEDAEALVGFLRSVRASAASGQGF